MARPPRTHEFGTIYHVMNRGNDGQDIFLGQNDYQRFTQILLRAKTRFGIQLFSTCLMPNHFHLLLRVSAIPLSRTMHWITTRYVKYFNLNKTRIGHLFQRRFKSLRCGNDGYFLTLLRYINLNPVRSGLVRHPREWPWSGYRELAGEHDSRILDPEFPLSLLHEDGIPKRDQLLRFIDTGLAECKNYPDPFSDTAENILKNMEERHRCAPQVKKRTDLGTLAKGLSQEAGLSLATLTNGHRSRLAVRTRRLFMRMAIADGWMPGQIALFLNCNPSSVSRAFLVQP
ncbi:MAG: transposase [Elusimicrobia bacterium]|nr:transposase [Elusimicrobiota bacterium]